MIYVSNYGIQKRRELAKNYQKQVKTDKADIKNMEKLIDFLDDNDDVQNVCHNWEQD